MPSIRRFFEDRDGRIVVMQFPNPPLWAWLALRIAAFFAPDRWRDGLSLLATAALFTWAYLEITEGASPFRRTLGGVVLAAIVVGAFR